MRPMSTHPLALSLSPWLSFSIYPSIFHPLPSSRPSVVPRSLLVTILDSRCSRVNRYATNTCIASKRWAAHIIERPRIEIPSGLFGSVVGRTRSTRLVRVVNRFHDHSIGRATRSGTRDCERKIEKSRWFFPFFLFLVGKTGSSRCRTKELFEQSCSERYPCRQFFKCDGDPNFVSFSGRSCFTCI